jgi:hypothetical protein
MKYRVLRWQIAFRHVDGLWSGASIVFDLLNYLVTCLYTFILWMNDLFIKSNVSQTYTMKFRFRLFTFK